MSRRQGAFISYARLDGSAFAAELRERLLQALPGLMVWHDLADMEGGQGWWPQIERAIDSVEHVIIVLTPGALRSEQTFKEWSYARQQGLSILPIKGPGYQFSDPKIPRWLAKAHCYDLGQQWPVFVTHLTRGTSTARVPQMAPALPENFVDRPAHFSTLKLLLLDAKRGEPVAITTALKGAGGFGKTVLAAALCHDREITTAFDDGVLWTTLGHKPNVTDALGKIYAALTTERPQFRDVEDAATALAERLHHKACLIVIDDVWRYEDVEPFLRGAKGCARLITTRSAEVVQEASARKVRVDEMTRREATTLLAKPLGKVRFDGRVLEELARRLGEWPLLLKLTGAALARRVDLGDTVQGAVLHALEALKRAGVTAFDRRSSADRTAAVELTMQASLALLDPFDVSCCLQLAVFPEDHAIPIAVLQSLWGIDSFDTQQVAARLDEISLLDLDVGAGVVRQHDVIREYLAKRLGQQALIEAHARIIDAWGPDHRVLPDEYAWQRFGYHFAGAGRTDELQTRLADFRWLQAKLMHTHIVALIEEYRYVPPTPDLDRILDALRLSSHVLAKDRAALAQQLLGRIPASEQLRRVITDQALAQSGLWLRPLSAQLWTVDGELIRIVEVSSREVRRIAVSNEGDRLLSVGDDGAVRCWNLQTGRELWAHRWAGSAPTDIGFLASSLYLWMLTRNGTWMQWDPRTSEIVRTVDADLCAVAADGLRALRFAEYGKLQLIDLESGEAIATSPYRRADIMQVVAASDGYRWVICHYAQGMLFWRVDQTGERTLQASSNIRACAVSISGDGRRVVTHLDEKLTVWDFDSGRPIKEVTCHPVHEIFLNADGTLACGWDMENRALRFWDLAAGTMSLLSNVHSARIWCARVAPDGAQLITAGGDASIKYWRANCKRAVSPPAEHGSSVTAIAIGPDNRCAVSIGGEVRVWNVEDGSHVRTLQCRTRDIESAAVSTDGERVTFPELGWKGWAEWCLTQDTPLHTTKAGPDWGAVIGISAAHCFLVRRVEAHRVGIHDRRTGALLRELTGHNAKIERVTASADGTYLTGMCDDGSALIWDLASGKAVAHFERAVWTVTAAACADDMSTAITADHRGAATVWDLVGRKALAQHRVHTDRICALHILGKRGAALTASRDRSIKVWELGTGTVLTRYWCEASVTACVVTSDQRTVVAGDENGRIHILRLEGTTLHANEARSPDPIRA